MSGRLGKQDEVSDNSQRAGQPRLTGSESFALGPFVLDATAKLLLLEGTPVALGERAVAVLCGLRLNPLDPTIHILSCGMAGAWFVKGDLEQVLLWDDKSLREGPVFLAALRSKVVVLGLMGRVDEAKALVPALLDLEPNLRCSSVGNLVPLGPDLLLRYAAGLRAAGIPE